MNRTEFIIATAIILFVAFALGWFANWLIHRLTRVSQADLGELDNMARLMHQAEEARDQALAYLQERESEMSDRLHEAEAELRVTRETLREAQAENSEMRDYIERVSAHG
ncbi:hypothetical protein [Palleronia sp. LCG004]|uniref:hypothetical protein n=1 Tax=Palleronia sp. LCG004 TaxID=3079304 RepID=UPI00294395CD|nr:hypothetical protein [Palleronia sp. LCG004]WOI56065.1 hypothetical protein RVY76_13640 [Palleronia sp. LCG004]